MSEITLRPVTPEDASSVAWVFHRAVWIGAKDHYTRAQLQAWAGDVPDPARWRDRLRALSGFVAMIDDACVGVMTMDETGYIDLAFVAPGFAGQGVGHALHQAVEARARELGAATIHTHASRAARGFFERQGLRVETAQTVEREGVALENFIMSRHLGR